MKTKCSLIAALFIMTFFSPVSALAENDPKDAICPPGGTSFFLFYYRHYSGDELYANGTKTADNIDYQLDMAIFRYAHFVSLGDWTWSYDLLQPVGDLDFNSFNSNGLADTNAATHINTPVLWQSDKMTYMMSAGFYLSAPTGEYEASDAVNLGTNRWSYKFEYTPLILQVDKFSWEVTGDVTFYTDNDDYGASSADLETDPLYGFQTHVAYNITDTFWVGLSYYYYSGAENEVNGVSQDDETKTQALRFSASFNLAPNVIMLLQYEHELERDNGLKQNFIGTRIAYVF